MSSSLLRRLLGAALAGALVLTVVSLSPAQAHVTSSFTHLWKHIQKKADKRYAQKSKALPSRTAAVTSNAAIALDGTVLQTLMQTSIVAPQTGFLVISGNGAFFTSGTPVIHCGISVDGSSAWPGTYALASVSATSDGFTECGPQTRIPVTAGAHTIAYQAHNDGLASGANFEGGSVLVTFEPYGSAGLPGLGKPLPAPRGGDLVKQRLNSH